MSLFRTSANPKPASPVKIEPPPAAATASEPAETSEKQFAASFVEDLCLCQVCYMKFNETTKLARVLHCGHTFCTECIATVKKYGNSAHVECPTCRTETKCAMIEIAPNFMVMETIRKFGFLGPPVAVVEEKKNVRKKTKNETVSEMVDESYRVLLSNVKAELMAKFEVLRNNVRGIHILAIRRELVQLSEEVEKAVQDAYNGYSESEGDADSSDESDSSIEAARFAEHAFRVENPVNPNRSDIDFESSESESESSDGSTSSGSTSSDDSSSSYTSGESS